MPAGIRFTAVSNTTSAPPLAPPSAPREVKSYGWYKQMNLGKGKNILNNHEMTLNIHWSYCERTLILPWAYR
jgi:hypothetical protein